MTCWFCAKGSKGTCRFCGRGVCEDHAKFGPYVIEVIRSETRNRTEALVVEDALNCGACHPPPATRARPRTGLTGARADLSDFRNPI